MRCVQCGHLDSAVIDSRDSEDGASIRRRRECSECRVRFTTYERLEQPRLMVVKKDGARQLFDRQKLAVGVYKAFHKRPVSVGVVESLLDDVEREMREWGCDEVASERIGAVVMEKIEEVDHVAYIRFAAVYRDFTNLDTFASEIKKLIAKQNSQKTTNISV